MTRVAAPKKVWWWVTVIKHASMHSTKEQEHKYRIQAATADEAESIAKSYGLVLRVVKTELAPW